jgi:hypothetical protein
LRRRQPQLSLGYNFFAGLQALRDDDLFALLAQGRRR